MNTIVVRFLTALLLTSAVLAVACEGDSDVTSDEARDTASDTANTVREEANDAWASLRTDGERLIDEVQTRNDPEAKDQLLDRCRDAEERLRENDNPNADRVNEFCDRVRDADPENSSVWEQIKSEFDQLRDEFQS